MRKLSKRHRKAREVADLKMEYPLDEAVALLMKMPDDKFDETVAQYAGVRRASARIFQTEIIQYHFAVFVAAIY